MELLYFLVSLGACVIGGICGIGGGIIIKPTLDMAGLGSASTISFLSACTVLCMSTYNVANSLRKHKGTIDLQTGTPLAIGAAVGGVCGNGVFSAIKSMVGNDGLVVAIQSVCLLLLTLATLVYTMKKRRITPHTIENKMVCVVIGLLLGGFSSFLGIGGGPFNLVVLHFFFAMESKKAAANSLYIIFFSQITNVLMYFLRDNVPEFSVMALVLMAVGAIGGGKIGRSISERIDDAAVDKLFMGLLVAIMGICVWNTTGI